MKRRPVGRPSKKNKVAPTSFRLAPAIVKLLKAISAREKLPQARIIEIALSRHAKDIKLA